MQQPVTSLSFGAEVEAYGATRTITARGELDVAVTETLAAAMRRALGDAPEIVVLDLSSVTFIDAAGVRAVVSAHRRAQARSAEVTIIPAPTAVHRVFVLVGVASALPFAPGTLASTPPGRHAGAASRVDVALRLRRR
jgi:anti-sigma B factor antagonist